MVSQQTSTGAFFLEDQRVDLHAEALAAVVAGVTEEATIEDALSYIEENGEDGATEGARTGRIIAGIVAGGENPHDFGGVDYAAILASQFDAATGTYLDTTNPVGDLFSHLLAANGDIAADGELATEAKDYILGQQCPDGGFAFGGSADCAFNDVDTTALAINALANSGLEGADIDGALSSARSRLLAVQTADGGFPFCCGGETSSDSTGLALAALAALGEDGESHPWMQPDGDDPVEALQSLQTAEGSFKSAERDFEGNPIAEGNALSTINATAGMAGRSYPIPAVEPDSDATPTPTPTAEPVANDDEEEEEEASETTVAGTITLPDTGDDPGATSAARTTIATGVAGLALVGAGIAGLRVRKQRR